ncbi:hypothetical protein D5086_005518 [Populus alba]|uniref:Uncharacterized protein n=1 Tax=Populus alba TaxID=43335 RepID=A0ACC4CTE5_POPAL
MTKATEGESVTLDLLKVKMAEFAKERNWDQFHSPRNLLLALVGEVGELSEIFQWRGEVPKGLPDWKEEDKVHLGEELSDVLLYLVRLSDICGVDLGKAALRKIMFTVLEDESNLSDRYGGDSVTFFPVCSFGFQPFSQPFLSFYGFLDVEGKECNLRNAKGKGGNGL